MQTLADGVNRQRQVSCMTNEKGETWSPSEMSQVRTRPDSLVADCCCHTYSCEISYKVNRNVIITCEYIISRR